MDEAIAELDSAFYFITSLRLRTIIEKEQPQHLFMLSDSIKKQLAAAYKCFVTAVLQEELSYKPLGILRPGILNVMKSLYQLQKDNKIAHVVIYSNNDSLPCLEFIRDLIHEHLETTDLIYECAYRTHPLRDEFAPHNRFSKIDKSWACVKRVLVEGRCKAPVTLSPEDVYFFDDLLHPDLQQALGKQYHRVPPYEFKASYRRLVELYLTALIDGKVSIFQFAPLIDMVYGGAQQIVTLQNILRLFQSSTVRTASYHDVPPLHDRGIMIMKNAVYSLKHRVIKKKTNSRRRTHKKDI